MARNHSQRNLIALVVLGLWYATVLIWATQPLSENLQVGTDFTADPPSQLTVTVECNNVFSSSTRSKELPALPPQPDGQPPLAFPREPCQFAQADARRAVVIDTLVVVLAAIGLIWVGRRRDDSDDSPAIPASEAPLVG